jgi:hypothetical protein
VSISMVLADVANWLSCDSMREENIEKIRIFFNVNV